MKSVSYFPFCFLRLKQFTLIGFFLILGGLAFAESGSESTKWKYFGDLRLTSEFGEQEGEKNNFEKNRFRLRAGIHYNAFEDLTATASLGGGQSALARSDNMSMTGGFSKKSVWIDQASLRWALFNQSSVTAGKHKIPFYRPGDSQLIWDKDIRPEGLTLQLSGANFLSGFEVLLGAYDLVEESLSKKRVGMNAAQLIYGISNLPMAIKVSASLYDFLNLQQALPSQFSLADDFGYGGNTEKSGGGFQYDFDVAEGGLVVDSGALFSIPLEIAASLVRNLEMSKDSQAWMGSAALGKAVQPKSWSLKYSYRDIEKDAVVSAFTESDFSRGFTGVRGHQVSVEYVLRQGLRGSVIGQMAQIRRATSTDYKGLHIHLSLEI